MPIIRDMRFELLLIPALVSMGSLVAADAVLTVTGVDAKGAVEMPVLTLTLDDLAKMPRTKASMSEDKHTNTYEGVPVYEILKRAGQPFGVEMPGLTLTLDDLAKMPRTKASMSEDKHTNTYE